MSFLKKVRDLPETQKRIILWSIIVIIGVAFFIFWLKNVRKTLQNFPATELKREFSI